MLVLVIPWHFSGVSVESCLGLPVRPERRLSLNLLDLLIQLQLLIVLSERGYSHQNDIENYFHSIKSVVLLFLFSTALDRWLYASYAARSPSANFPIFLHHLTTRRASGTTFTPLSRIRQTAMVGHRDGRTILHWRR